MYSTELVGREGILTRGKHCGEGKVREITPRIWFMPFYTRVPKAKHSPGLPAI